MKPEMKGVIISSFTSQPAAGDKSRFQSKYDRKNQVGTAETNGAYSPKGSSSRQVAVNVHANATPCVHRTSEKHKSWAAENPRQETPLGSSRAVESISKPFREFTIDLPVRAEKIGYLNLRSTSSVL
jgi:hypothetical protein